MRSADVISQAADDILDYFCMRDNDVVEYRDVIRILNNNFKDILEVAYENDIEQKIY